MINDAQIPCVSCIYICKFFVKKLKNEPRKLFERSNGTQLDNRENGNPRIWRKKWSFSIMKIFKLGHFSKYSFEIMQKYTRQCSFAIIKIFLKSEDFLKIYCYFIFFLNSQYFKHLETDV